MNKNKTVVVLVLASLVFSAHAKKSTELSIQQRLLKLEQQSQQPSSTVNAADSVIQNQKLQQQVAELKGIIEEQNHQIENLKEKQKLLYLDVDSRLQELEEKSGKTAFQPIKIDNTSPDNVSSAKNTVAEPVNSTEPILTNDQEEYDIAFAHLRAGRFLESARAFEDFIQKHPNNELTDNAYYWLGESYYVKRQYPQALAAFQSLMKIYPSSSKAPDSLLKIGYSYYEMDDLVKADENLKAVINNYPNSSVARLAKNRLSQIQRDH